MPSYLTIPMIVEIKTLYYSFHFMYTGNTACNAIRILEKKKEEGDPSSF